MSGRRGGSWFKDEWKYGGGTGLVSSENYKIRLGSDKMIDRQMDDRQIDRQIDG